ncbi:methyltransferase domain-containing protein [Terasakiella sp. SH-1]|uniref:methyltransferase domain-containing protein n=1 Tax=Terasakiella sp. SH-1 TaxID=2560057 RepID=UPI0010734ABE|nr:methyltransferase domain-containing protein [Terasakiella sp. SH-1]
MNKKHIAASFSKASSTYEREAPVQKWTAGYVRDYVETLDIAHDAKCLEIGCGTGFLTENMQDLLGQADWLVTDLSDDMLAQCQKRIGNKVRFHNMDGEFPDLDEKFDLIVSSLAFQWFTDLELSCKRLISLLKPNGRLIFTTLGCETFQEWRYHMGIMQLPVGLHNYPDLADLKTYDFPECRIQFSHELRVQKYDNGLSFLRALKAIGAQEPRHGHQPLSAGQMRKALRALDQQQDCVMTYEIILGDLQLIGTK